MSRTANINVRIEPEVKHAAEKLYSGAKRTATVKVPHVHLIHRKRSPFPSRGDR